jgi:integrase
MRRLHPDLFDRKHPNPWDDFTLKSRTKTKKHAVTRDEVYRFAWGCIKHGRPEPAAVAVICFEWLQRPENVVAGFLTWPDYRSKSWPHAVRIEHHKNKTLVWHPLEDKVDGEILKFYAEAEDVLGHLRKLGVPMIMRRIERGEHKGEAKVWSYPGMEKVVQQMRKKIDGVSELFTLDACRHGGMTELEEAELTDGQGRALSGHKTAQAYRGYAKETMQRALAATRKRHAHLLAQKQFEQQDTAAAVVQDQTSGDGMARQSAS